MLSSHARSIGSCKAFRKPDKQFLSILSDPGLSTIGVRVFKDKTGKPVIYVWQAFTYIRLSWKDAKALAEIVAQIKAKRLTSRQSRKNRRKRRP